ncbi:MAG: hypothetical protein GY851_36940 [bacterium]|nr:hypothetical protein [bacterium]
MAKTIRRISCVAALAMLAVHAGPVLAATADVDPVSRYVHVSYTIPAEAPAEVSVRCEWSPTGADAWRPARVTPLLSETGLALVTGEEWTAWTHEGRIIERRAAGLTRTAVFNPYPDAQTGGVVDVGFRVSMLSPDGTCLATDLVRIQADNRDVVYIEDWTEVLTKSAVVKDGEEDDGAKWAWKTGLDDASTFGNALFGSSAPRGGLPKLCYPLDLKGSYAVFFCTPAQGGIGLRLTGDERTDRLGSPRARQEVLWRWTPMDRQHLVLSQLYRYTGWAAASMDYVKLVPLSDAVADKLDAQFGNARDKFVAGYWEPYSWAFHENVHSTLQHREPLSAFAEAGVDLVDTQIGRFGMKVVYESRHTDPLYYATQGDPIGTVAKPQTDNVGRMQQYTNTLDATLRYTRELGAVAHANFGASNCYPGSPLQGNFSKEHPDWMRGSALRYEVPEVRAYVLTLYREALEAGAPGISIDFCRYPGTVDSVETGNAIMQELRALADEFQAKRSRHVTILVRFPGIGVRRHELFDYATWVSEGWVDYLCPSNIQGRHLHIDMTPYFDAAKGTPCTVLPALDGLSWGQPFPDPFLWRAHQLYEQGARGVYVYQADSRVLGRPGHRRTMRMLGSSDAIREWWRMDEESRPRRSKRIAITPCHQIGGYHGWERIRIWIDGVPLGPVEVYLDETLVGRFDGPPYLVGTEDNASDKVIAPGDHVLTIRARDGEDWLEQSFTIQGAG